MEQEIHPDLLKTIGSFQKNEVTEYHIYQRLAAIVRDEKNAGVLGEMASEELAHSRIWQGYTGEEKGPDHLRTWWYVILARLLGITFAIKMMERGRAVRSQHTVQCPVSSPGSKRSSGTRNSTRKRSSPCSRRNGSVTWGRSSSV